MLAVDVRPNRQAISRQPVIWSMGASTRPPRWIARHKSFPAEIFPELPNSTHREDADCTSGTFFC